MPTNDNNIFQLRNRLRNAKYGKIFDEQKILEDLLSDGVRRVQEQPIAETLKGDSNHQVTPREEKCLERIDDSALSFIPQMETLVQENIYADCAKKMYCLIKMSNELVKENGALRYKGDKYLKLDWHKLKKQMSYNANPQEAQWFLVSEISSAYGTIVEELLDNIEKKGSMTQKDKKYLDIAIQKQTEFINRSYARITPKGMTKSNGYSCPAYKVPEAYEAVTCNNGKIKYVPGAHPLTWAHSSLKKASDSFIKNLERIEKLSLL